MIHTDPWHLKGYEWLYKSWLHTQTKSVWFPLFPEVETIPTGKCELKFKLHCQFFATPLSVLFHFLYLFEEVIKADFPEEPPAATVNILSHSSLHESLGVFMLLSERCTSWSQLCW